MIMISSSLLLIAATVLCTCAVALPTEETCASKKDTKTSLQSLAIANNDMAVNLYKILSSNSLGNLAFSPLSISLAFGMLHYGVRGNTSAELRTAFGYDTADLEDNLVPDTFNVLLNKLLREESESGYVLQTANSILASRTLRLVHEFKREVGLFYKASVFEDDFEKYPVEVVHRINKWVREKTHGKINHLLDRLSPSAKMIVLNAMYFKGAWMVKFPEENTQDRLFYNYGLQSEAKYVPMMHLNTRFRYAEMNNYDMLELPFEMRNITMLLLLPRERNGLPALEESLTLKELSEAQRRLYFTKVDLYLPKFKLEYSKELSDEIKELGARSIFNAESADFSGITPSKNVSISEVIHKAMIEVNEKGSEAAAVTGIVTFRMSQVRDDIPLIMADHPFMLLLLENRRMVFFMARVAAL